MKLVIADLLAASLPVSAQQIQVSKENKTIAVNVTGEAEMVADTAVISVGFRSYGKEQDATYADATRTSNAIMDALLQAGIAKTAVESQSQSLNLIEFSNDEDKKRYAQGLRYEFEQSWRVTVSAAQAADILQVAITHGANSSGGITWKMRSEEELEAAAGRKALERARKTAEEIAKGLGTKLGSLVYASNQTPPRGYFGGMLNTESASLSSRINLKPLAITPERITRSATVYAVFAIE